MSEHYPDPSERPLFSVGIPVYNGESYLSRALDALLAEGLESELEILISDNASTDRTQEICESYATRYSNVRYSRESQNLGAAYNYNRVLAMASGTYFKWNAHDDYILPGYFQRVRKEFESCPELIGVFSQGDYVDDGGAFLFDTESVAPLAPWPPEPLAQGMRLLDALFKDGRPAMALVMGVYRVATIREVRPIGNYFSADWIICLELSLAGRLRYLTQSLLIFTKHTASSSYRDVPNAREQQEFYDPSVRSSLRIAIQHRRRFLEMFRSIHRSHLSWRDKCRLDISVFRFAARRTIWRIGYAFKKQRQRPS